MNQIDEIWRDVVGFETEYEVSNLGRVRSKDRISDAGYAMKSKMLSITIWNGAKTVNIYRTKMVHKLVAEAFIPKSHPECSRVMFRDGDRMNVCVDNLYWYLSPSRVKKKKQEELGYPGDYVVQLRGNNGEFVRRYQNVDEVLQVHPTWEKQDVMNNLIGLLSECHGYRFVYEADYEKLNNQ